MLENALLFAIVWLRSIILPYNWLEYASFSYILVFSYYVFIFDLFSIMSLANSLVYY